MTEVHKKIDIHRVFPDRRRWNSVIRYHKYTTLQTKLVCQLYVPYHHEQTRYPWRQKLMHELLSARLLYGVATRI